MRIKIVFCAMFSLSVVAMKKPVTAERQMTPRIEINCKNIRDDRLSRPIDLFKISCHTAKPKRPIIVMGIMAFMIIHGSWWFDKSVV